MLNNSSNFIQILFKEPCHLNVYMVNTEKFSFLARTFQYYRLLVFARTAVPNELTRLIKTQLNSYLLADYPST